MKINNCIQLHEQVSGWKVEMEDRAIQLMEKMVFKYTDCGCSFDADEKGVWVCGYAEGSDAELPMRCLEWGFTMEEFNSALEQADIEGVEEWDRANEYDLARVVDEENWGDHKERDGYELSGNGGEG